MTEAKSAAETRLAVTINGVKTYFKEVKSIPSMGTSPATIDATHLESDAKEYIMDIPDQSDSLEFTMNAMPTGATDSNYDLIQTLDPKEKYTWIVEYTQLGVGCTVQGYWNWSMGEAAVSSVMEVRLSIVPSGAPTFYSLSNTYEVTYDANGATGTVTDSNTYTNGQTVTVLGSTGLTYEGYEFLQWNTKADNSGTTYAPDATFKIYKDTTLYAIWREL